MKRALVALILTVALFGALPRAEAQSSTFQTWWSTWGIDPTLLQIQDFTNSSLTVDSVLSMSEPSATRTVFQARSGSRTVWVEIQEETGWLMFIPTVTHNTGRAVKETMRRFMTERSAFSNLSFTGVNNNYGSSDYYYVQWKSEMRLDVAMPVQRAGGSGVQEAGLRTLVIRDSDEYYLRMTGVNEQGGNPREYRLLEVAKTVEVPGYMGMLYPVNLSPVPAATAESFVANLLQYRWVQFEKNQLVRQDSMLPTEYFIVHAGTRFLF